MENTNRFPSLMEHDMPRLQYGAFAALLFVLSVSIGFAQPGIISTYAGPGMPVIGELAVNQPMDLPVSVVPDEAGGYYVACKFQNRVYRIDANGKIRLAAGNGIMGYSGDGRAATSAQLNAPQSIALDSMGNLYIADTNNNRIRKVTPAGIISTVAGNGSAVFAGDGGSATAAGLNNPIGVAVDSAGSLFIADHNNNRIRKVTPDGKIQTVAGSASYGYAGDGGAATAAALYDPRSVAVDSKGNLYIADFYNARIRKVTPTGVISTVAGNGSSGFAGDGGPATAAQIGNPWGVAIDSAGTLYLSDNTNGQVRKVAAGGMISTAAGTGTSGFSGDGEPGPAAQIYKPREMAVDPTGNLYIADSYNNRIRKVTLDGRIHTVAGNGIQGFEGDGGPATAAMMRIPNGMALDFSGNLYIADSSNNRIRKITPDGVISTVAGSGTAGYSGDGGSATLAQLNNPSNVVVDPSGNLYIADGFNWRIRKVAANGIITTFVGTGNYAYSGDGGRATAARITYPAGMTFDSAGNFYFADYGNHRIRKVTADGMISTAVGNGTAGYRGDNGSAKAASLNHPTGVAIDSAGNIYIGDAGNNVVRMVTSGGIINSVAGNGIMGYSGDGGPATMASLNGGLAVNPMIGVTIDSANNLLIADTGNNIIRKVTPDGIINTIVGNGSPGFSGDWGIATTAQLSYPATLVIDSAGNFYISDGLNYRIRKVTNITDCSSLAVKVGGVAACRTAGMNSQARTGYANLPVKSGDAPYGTAVFRFKKDGVTMTEAGIPASPPTTHARIFIDYRASVTAIPGQSSSGMVDINTGLSVVNQGMAKANVTYTLSNLSGNNLAAGHGTIAQGNHIACFINQLQEAAPDFSLPMNFQSNTQYGTLEISSDQPLSIAALRMTTNQRGDILYTTTPVADMNRAVANTPLYFPQFVDGNGYTTSLILLNTSNQTETGNLQILDNNGSPWAVHQTGGTTNSTFPYTIPAGGAYYFQSDGLSSSARAGWVRVVPDASSMAPVGSGVFSYNPNGVMVSESGIPSSAATTHARVYVDLSGGHDVGLAVANIGNAETSIEIHSYQTDGVSGIGTSWGPWTLAANGHDAKFTSELIEGLPSGYRGVLEIRSETPFAALTIRSLINERDDFLMTTFPISDASRTAPSPVIFPHVADGGGYVTEFILISAGAPASTTPAFYNDSGAAVDFSH
jgi:trimeric autotransporter adhesin